MGDLGWSESGLSWIVLEKDDTQGLGAHEVSLVCEPSAAP